jgi:phage/conjugal plasmid C-4 type zinc finger TraR family protein
MADIADIGNEEMQRQLDAALAAFQPATGESLSECEACGNDIPEARQKAVDGCRTCIECERVRELMGRARR